MFAKVINSLKYLKFTLSRQIDIQRYKNVPKNHQKIIKLKKICKLEIQFLFLSDLLFKKTERQF